MLSPSMALPSRAMIGRWTVDQYIRFSRWWVAVGVAVVMLTTAFHLLPGTALPWNAAIFFLIGAMVNRLHGGKTESLTAGAMVGLVIGLISAAVNLVLEPTVVAVVNLIAETLLSGLVAALIAAIGLILSQMIWRQS